jgi:hypothetical protein
VRVLLDQGAPRGLLKTLADCVVATAASKGWQRLKNGELLNAAEVDGFDLLITTDANLRYQQNLSSRTISIIVLTGDTRWSSVRDNLGAVREAVDMVTVGSFAEVQTPLKPKPPRRHS